LIEHAADNFITSLPAGIELCGRLGLADQLLATAERFRKAYVVHQGRLVSVPEGFALLAPAKIWPVLTTPLLTLGGKLRVAWEYFLPARRDAADESLESFAVRRLGRQAYERIVQPLVGGIYTADPARLSLAATLPRFLEMERRHGGLIRGALRASRAQRETSAQASGARYGLFVAPRDGMASLVAALADRLPAGAVRLNSPVTRLLRRDDGRWNLSIGGDAEETYDSMIVTTSAPAAARLIAPVDEGLSRLLGQIAYAGASLVCLGYRRDEIAHPLDGFGFVVPQVEKRRIVAASFASVKFPGRAPPGHELIRVFIGGALQPQLGDLPDDQLLRIAHEELAELLGLRGQPQIERIFRWQGSMPQYHLGHLELISQIETRVAALPGLALAGNAYRGVGIPQCIASGEAAAASVLGLAAPLEA
jgi:oxygen-dependent protoporphyrinogen oxidase